MKNILLAIVFSLAVCVTAQAFDAESDSADWRAATYQQKLAFCNAYADRIQSKRPGITGSFLVNNVNEFYSSDNSNVRTTTVHDIMALIAAAYGK